ncbi:type VI secretion system lipoprotein TssJ [Geomonas subterranea]|uniref:Type VI secretion system lipoprotein TssJ n=1 Tax=Geomonas subterranea TaxID=2847989 RepID=A0ABX8LPF1_9BACT|nr:type VI secretion system lipoprotein TssJ [Geomonas subterranea]QXE92851.1 type VI secretion system lipoprotein TssJ [Geomonas subterranea]QXM09044.1 type VI secretion system lipoprotein TssJ [Geomonas subterranea]
MRRILLVASALGLLAGCTMNMRLAENGASTPPVDVIRLKVRADPELNRYDRNSHALLLCLYQLKEPEGFRQLAQNRDGVPKLLECDRFDTSVVSARLIVVQPGQALSQSCDKGEGARYLGLATGYYSQGRRKVTELLAMPSGTAAKPPQGLLHLDLGAQEITNARVE